MRPVVALNCNWTRAGGRPRLIGDSRYSDAVFDAGGEPVVAGCIAEDAYVERLLALADGVVLVGSDDLDPRLYGETRSHPKTVRMHRRRQAFDLAFGKAALRSGKPILGVCGGLQLVNVLMGGSLWQHLETADAHKGPKKDPRRHPIEIAAGTHLARILGAGETVVNSFHHQGVRRVADGLRVSARAPDDVLEGLETADGRVVLVQWHPEREVEGTREALFGWLVEAARRGFRRVEGRGG